VQKDGVRLVTEIRFKPPVKIDPAKLIDYAGCPSWSPKDPPRSPSR
jgi:hypothetical protein